MLEERDPALEDSVLGGDPEVGRRGRDPVDGALERCPASIPSWERKAVRASAGVHPRPGSGP